MRSLYWPLKQIVSLYTPGLIEAFLILHKEGKVGLDKFL